MSCRSSFALALVGGALLCPSVAHAGTYDVYSCWAGSDSFRNPGANGSAWTKTSDPGGQYGAFDQCGATWNGFGVISIGGYEAPAGRWAEVAFAAPPGLRVAAVRLWRTAWSSGSGAGGASKRNYLRLFADGALSPRGDAFDGSVEVPIGAAGSPASGLTAGNEMMADLAATTPSSVSYRVGCGFAAGCPTGDSQGNFAAGVHIYGAVVTVRDTIDPTLSVSEGGLLGGGTHRGIEVAHVSSASDGAGIKRIAVFADDATTPIGLIDYERNPDRCAWWQAAPCSNVSDVDIPVDTRQLADGNHRLTVKAYDAAENVRAVRSDVVTVANTAAPLPPVPAFAAPLVVTGPPAAPVSALVERGALNGVNASDHVRLTASFERNRRSSLRTTFSRRAGVRGTLRDEAGRPVTEAEVSVGWRAGKGRAEHALGVAHTDDRGAFRFVAPARQRSRLLVVSYRSHHGDATPAASHQLSLTVAAGVRLKASPGHVRNGRAVTFSGRLLGAPVPRSGKVVVMQVRIGGSWRAFATVRARGASGAFRYRYRFTRTAGRTTYRFRALSRVEAAYPYATGASRAVRVRVN